MDKIILFLSLKIFLKAVKNIQKGQLMLLFWKDAEQIN